MTPWERIFRLMHSNGVSSKQLAEIAGVVPSSVTKWKNGASIRNDSLQRIALHFGKSVDYLLTGTITRIIDPETPSTLERENAFLREEVTHKDVEILNLKLKLDAANGELDQCRKDLESALSRKGGGVR